MSCRASETAEDKLSKSLSAGFWSPDLCLRQAGRTQRSASRVRLTPLGHDAPRAPESDEELNDSLPSPIARAPSVGHLGTLWGLRHSAPTGLSAWRMSDSAEVVEARGATRQGHNDVRSRRVRRPADFGASLSGCARLRSSHSCTGAAGEARASCSLDSAGSADLCVHAISNEKTSAAHRWSSVPPTGTSKADEAAGATAKARAVAALQRLFFEEMGKNGQDANGAAARALLRLSEAPPALPRTQSAQSSGSVGDQSHEAPPPSERDTSGPRRRQADDEAPDAVEEAPARVLPRRPAAVEGRRKRPCPAPRIKVGA